MKKFWKWMDRKIRDQSGEEKQESVLFMNGVIAEESWYGDEITPAQFKAELEDHPGDITIWIHSPGGDCIAAAQIYNMMMEHKGSITVKIDGIAASAASVIAMAGTEVLMSPVSMMMIHNPATIAWGDQTEMQKAIDMLGSVKDSIINAYETKTDLSRAEISNLMDAETWMDAHKAVDLGFADGILQRQEPVEDFELPETSMIYSSVTLTNQLKEKLEEKCRIETQPEKTGRSVEEIRNQLEIMKKFI